MNYLSSAECYQELSVALESATDANRLPIQTLLLYFFGYTPEHLIRELHITANDFRKWLQQYTTQGLSAFTSQEKVVPDDYRDAAIEALTSPPPQMFSSGFEFWTVEALAKYLTWKTGIDLSVKELKKVLAEAGYRMKRFHRINV